MKVILKEIQSITDRLKCCSDSPTALHQTCGVQAVQLLNFLYRLKIIKKIWPASSPKFFSRLAIYSLKDYKKKMLQRASGENSRSGQRGLSRIVSYELF